VSYENASHDASHRAQREADGVVAGGDPERDAGADANDEPQTREALLQSIHRRSSALVVKRPRIDDGLHLALGARHGQQAAHHRRLALGQEEQPATSSAMSDNEMISYQYWLST
jgi:hypothetical protein